MRRVIATVALGVLVSACGSTVQTTSTATIGGDGLGSAGTGGELGGTGATGVLPGSGSSTTGGTGVGSGSTGLGSVGTTGTGGSTGSTGRGSSGAASGAVSPGAKTGLGVTATTISVGIGYADDEQAANAAIGAAGLSTGDEKANMQALVDEVNAHGGVAGRKLVPVFFRYSSTSSQPGSTQDEAACQHWTVDTKVLAVFASNLTDTLPACLKQHGVAFFKSGALVDVDQVNLRKYDNEILTGTMTLDRIFRDQVGALVRNAWFGGWNTVQGQPAEAPAKVGVITYDTDSYTRTLNGSLLPALRAAGHAPAPQDVFQVHKIAQQSEAAGLSAELKNASLRLQSDGVTHIVVGDASGLILIFFGANARTQNYYPRLGVNSGAGVQALYDQGLVSDRQVNGAAGNGWLPSIDVPAQQGNAFANSETRRCLDIMKRRTGQTYSSTNAASIALGDCDSVFLFQRAVATSRGLSPAAVLDAVGRLGSSFTSPLLGPTLLTATQHDEAVRAWDTTWTPSCTCMRYSHERRVPSLSS